MIEKDSKELKLNALKKTMIKHLVNSWDGVPQFQITMEINCTHLSEFRNSFAEKKPSINIIVGYCLKQVLVEHPIINSRIKDNVITTEVAINLGIAVSSKRGLLVPVIPNIEDKSFEEMTDYYTNVIIPPAKKGSYGIEHLTGGTITISNLGMYGVDSFTSIINSPETAILSVPAISEKLSLDKNGTVRNHRVMNLTGNFDHRVISGSDAAEFMQDLKDVIEDERIYEKLKKGGNSTL